MPDDLKHSPGESADFPPMTDDTYCDRERAREKLDDIKSRVKAALTAHGISYPVFLLIPNSGDALVTIGSITEPDPPDDEWDFISETVQAVLSDVTGIQNFQRHEVACASTHGAEVVR